MMNYKIKLAALALAVGLLTGTAQAGWMEEVAAFPMAAFGETVKQRGAPVPIQPGEINEEGKEELLEKLARGSASTEVPQAPQTAAAPVKKQEPDPRIATWDWLERDLGVLGHLGRMVLGPLLVPVVMAVVGVQSGIINTSNGAWSDAGRVVCAVVLGLLALLFSPFMAFYSMTRDLGRAIRSAIQGRWLD